MNYGSHANAKQILEYYKGKNRLIPSGWEFLGQGSTRNAYRGPDGIVYKLAHDSDNDWNEIEAEQARRFRGRKELTRLETVIPPTRLWWVGDDNVLAMGYAEGIRLACASRIDEPCDCRYWGERRICCQLLYDKLDAMGIPDMFYENVIYDGRVWNIIDLGSETL